MLDAMRSVVGDFDQAISRVERGERLFPGLMQAVPGEGPSQPVQPEGPPSPSRTLPVPLRRARPSRSPRRRPRRCSSRRPWPAGA